MILVKQIMLLIYFLKLGGGYEEKLSIFDSISEDDLIMAFFPCVRFENQIMLHFRGQCSQMRNWSIEQKMEYDMSLQHELTEMYDLVNKLCLICFKKHLRLIIENPYSEEHYLRRYWCYKPAIIDKDRRRRGDYYSKPTQYWFINVEPKNNFIFEAQYDNGINCKDAIRMMNKKAMKESGLNCSKKVARSMIHPDYANRFIREYIL